MQKTIRKTRHAHGYKATNAELDVVVKIAQESKIDEAWFGDIVEAKARDGKIVHIVWDRERHSWISFKFAVQMLDEGINEPFDYVTVKQALVFEKLLKKLGILEPEMDARWTVRCASSSKHDLFEVMKHVLEEDVKEFRFRPMEIKKRRGLGIHYLDIGGKGFFDRSVCRWACTTNGVPFDAWYTRNGKTHHYVYNGSRFCLCKEEPVKALMMPEDIVNAKGMD